MNEVLRQEKKYPINKIEGSIITSTLKDVMKEDEHNGEFGYLVRSLYFDTPYDKDYYEKVDGNDVRQKIRLRIYSPESNFAKLEIKEKQGIFQRKRSLTISRADAENLIRGNYSVILTYQEKLAPELFYILCTYCYRPKVIVEYTRTAFIANENETRITLDRDLRATEASYDLFSEDLLLNPVMDKFNDILEIKFNRFLLSYIRDIISITNKMEMSMSKYCLARN